MSSPPTRSPERSTTVAVCCANTVAASDKPHAKNMAATARFMFVLLRKPNLCNLVASHWWLSFEGMRAAAPVTTCLERQRPADVYTCRRADAMCDCHVHVQESGGEPNARADT